MRKLTHEAAFVLFTIATCAALAVAFAAVLDTPIASVPMTTIVACIAVAMVAWLVGLLPEPTP